MNTGETSLAGIAAPGRDAWDRLILASIWLLILAWAWYAFRGHPFDPLIALASQKGWRSHIVLPSMIWLSMAVALLAVRTLLWVRYRPFAAASPDEAPRLTVVIPAYNEGAMVARTIESCAGADYPAGRLEIIVVDDGSRDDTWSHVLAAKRRFPKLVRTIRFVANQGKRAALAAGFAKAGGDIVVTVDSDSVIDRGTLLALAGPFRDPKVGAVGGKVVVFNRNAGLLPRMLHVRFVLSFDFLRSVQSTYRMVYCCPGALTAYRASVLKRVVPGWRRQSFLGAECTIGEDRALTNDVMAAGFDTVYQRTAVVHTVVPQTYGKLCRMYLRWDRSYIREEIRLARIVWRRPLVPCLFTVLDKTLTNLRYPIGYGAIALTLAMAVDRPETLLWTLSAIGLAALFYSLYFLRSERSWQFIYGVLYAYFSSLALLWIFPWALLTVRSRSWLTR